MILQQTSTGTRISFSLHVLVLPGQDKKNVDQLQQLGPMCSLASIGYERPNTIAIIQCCLYWWWYKRTVSPWAQCTNYCIFHDGLYMSVSNPICRAVVLCGIKKALLPPEWHSSSYASNVQPFRDSL